MWRTERRAVFETALLFIWAGSFLELRPQGSAAGSKIYTINPGGKAQVVDSYGPHEWYRSCHFPIGEVGATMQWMGQFSRLRGVASGTVATALLLLAFSTSCSQSPATSTEDNNSSTESAKDQRHLPFHDASDSQGAGSDVSGPPQASDPQRTRVPFAASSAGTLPVGTLLTVRLNESLPGAKSKAGEPFTASLDDPVVVNGNTTLPRGTTVRGRVESMRAAVIQGNRGYLRLTLASMRVDGRDVPLETSSLFARGQALIPGTAVSAAFSPSKASNVVIEDRSAPVHVEKGRLLTFRLASPVSCPTLSPARMSKNIVPNGQ